MLNRSARAVLGSRPGEHMTGNCSRGKQANLGSPYSAQGARIGSNPYTPQVVHRCFFAALFLSFRCFFFKAIEKGNLVS